MDHSEPKTRQEKKGKGKSKQVYNQKTIRLKTAMMEKGVQRESGKKKTENK